MTKAEKELGKHLDEVIALYEEAVRLLEELKKENELLRSKLKAQNEKEEEEETNS